MFPSRSPSLPAVASRCYRILARFVDRVKPDTTAVSDAVAANNVMAFRMSAFAICVLHGSIMRRVAHLRKYTEPL